MMKLNDNTARMFESAMMTDNVVDAHNILNGQTFISATDFQKMVKAKLIIYRELNAKFYISFKYVTAYLNYLYSIGNSGGLAAVELWMNKYDHNIRWEIMGA